MRYCHFFQWSLEVLIKWYLCAVDSHEDSEILELAQEIQGAIFFPLVPAYKMTGNVYMKDSKTSYNWKAYVWWYLYIMSVSTFDPIEIQSQLTVTQAKSDCWFASRLQIRQGGETFSCEA